MLKASSKRALDTVLAAVDISVSPRGEGRTTPETELWSICRLASTLNRVSRLEFPIRFEKSERPDFVMFINGKERVGIEVTEVVHQDFAKLQTLEEAKQSFSVLDRSLFRWGDPRKSLDELRTIAAQTRLSGPGWEGYAVEMEFADAIADCVGKKTSKLKEETFSQFAEDWLLIYENLMLPHFDLPLAISNLRLKIPEYFERESFTRIFIESGRTIVELSRTTLSIHDLCDLW